MAKPRFDFDEAARKAGYENGGAEAMLTDLYVTRKLPMSSIAFMLETSERAVGRKLKELGIKARKPGHNSGGWRKSMAKHFVRERPAVPYRVLDEDDGYPD